MTTITLICVCDEEMCFCTERVSVEVDAYGAADKYDVACTWCEKGGHMWEPGGQRMPKPRRMGFRIGGET